MAEVVPAGTRPPEYGRMIPPDWREDEVAGAWSRTWTGRWTRTAGTI
ncbi:hypothetical protein EV193_11544 [Herbihabitans rhizosphaerae]|uniref:Uncharacterized protein n=1 Tax=Herbihabitans rhizosphaerae TaxID=1872711 RepID=A0A4Q7KCX0_9PSEU|nr:hypothetical protein EV193_11544 [Herbihabitans rhizosphaerae]